MADRALHLTLRGQPAELARIRPEVLAWLDSRNATERLRYDVELVLEELVTNVIKHGGAGGGDREIVLVLSVAGGFVTLSIADRGRPFDPRAYDGPELEPQIEERRTARHGLHLVRQVTEILSYRREGERNVLEVRFLEPLARPS